MPSALHHAARSGNLPELHRLLVESPHEIEACDDNGRTPLMVACLSSDAGVEAVRLLLDHGADVHAKVREDPLPTALDAIDEEGLDLDPEMAALFAQAKEIGKKAAQHPPDTRSVIALAVVDASLEKIRLLLERGADPHDQSPAGYHLILRAACQSREDVIDLLLAAGAPIDGVTSYGETALRVLSRVGKFGLIRKLLVQGADPDPLKWTPLMRAVALGSVADVKTQLDAGADLEARDWWERTAFLLSLHAGDPVKTRLLLEHGADRNVTGRCGKPPVHFAIDQDDREMLDWLISNHFDIHQTNEFGDTALKEAVESGAVRCFHRLLEAGADWTARDKYGDSLIANASHPEVIGALLRLGADAADLETEALRKWIGLGTVDALAVTKEEFLRDRNRRFGTANPERMDVPFWKAMVRNGWNGYRAASQFGEDSCDCGPVWCHDRFGMSLTPLPDGRFVQIAGEHEDSYDPDFCIYNDVIVHDGQGGFEIYGYPEDVFPPTDFHSATWLGEWIYVIGNLGYSQTHEAFGVKTPVFRLRAGSWEIERVATSGDDPGWIHKHSAKLADGHIRISGGKLLTIDEAGKTHIDAQTGVWSFDPVTAVWRKVED